MLPSMNVTRGGRGGARSSPGRKVIDDHDVVVLSQRIHKVQAKPAPSVTVER